MISELLVFIIFFFLGCLATIGAIKLCEYAYSMGKRSKW